MRSVFKVPNGEFHPNLKLNEDMRRDHQFDQELDHLANLAALGAKEIALRVAFDRGDYFSSIHAGLGNNRRGLVVGRVSATDFKAHWIERGHRIVTRDGRVVGQAKPKNVLARGARRAGLRVRSRRRLPDN
jgi:hypothetical protein